MSYFLEPLHYEFIWRALLCSALVGGLCGLLSVFLLLKGWSLIGDALSHAVVPGVALAYLWALPYGVGALSTGLLAGSAMLLLRRLTRFKQDAVIGFVFTSFFALGLFISSMYPSAVNLQAVIEGDILALDDGDMVQLLLVAVLALLFLALKWRDLMLLFFDPVQAATCGLRVGPLRWTFFLLVSAAVVAALQTVGAILVIALLITPGATAYMLGRAFGAVLLWAFCIGTSTALIGTYASYFLNVNTGAAVVILQSLLFFTVLLARRLLRRRT